MMDLLYRFFQKGPVLFTYLFSFVIVRLLSSQMVEQILDQMSVSTYKVSYQPYHRSLKSYKQQQWQTYL